MTTLFIYQSNSKNNEKTMADISYSAKINSKNLNDFFDDSEEESSE